MTAVQVQAARGPGDPREEGKTCRFSGEHVTHSPSWDIPFRNVKIEESAQREIAIMRYAPSI